MCEIRLLTHRGVRSEGETSSSAARASRRRFAGSPPSTQALDGGNRHRARGADLDRKSERESGRETAVRGAGEGDEEREREKEVRGEGKRERESGREGKR